MHRVKTLVLAYLKAFALYLLGIFLPMHTKRILLVTTLHLQLVRDGIFREETLEKLNQAMGLAKYEDALKVPAAVYDEVWDHDALSKAIHETVNGYVADACLPFEDAKKISESILNVTPHWLQYGRRDDMMKDLIQLFYCQASQPRAA